MNYMDEFRDRRVVLGLAERISTLTAGRSEPMTFMEVCGTHTMAIYQYGIRSLLPREVRLISGPGCPVCVTPNGYMDKAVAYSKLPETIIATFGDMVRVPGSSSSLMEERAKGADAACRAGCLGRRSAKLVALGTEGAYGISIAKASSAAKRGKRGNVWAKLAGCG